MRKRDQVAFYKQPKGVDVEGKRTSSSQHNRDEEGNLLYSERDTGETHARLARCFRTRVCSEGL